MIENNQMFKKNLFYLMKTYFVLILVYLIFWSCMGMSFFSFPIEGCMGELGPYQQLPRYFSIILSLLFYILMLGIFATHFFYQAKWFYSDKFYLAYKRFWKFGSITLSLTWLLLLWGGFDFNDYQNRYSFYQATGNIEFFIGKFISDFIFIAIPAVIIWHLVTAPANNQHEMKASSHDEV